MRYSRPDNSFKGTFLGSVWYLEFTLVMISPEGSGKKASEILGEDWLWIWPWNHWIWNQKSEMLSLLLNTFLTKYFSSHGTSITDEKMKKWILVINVLVTLNELNNFPWQSYYQVEYPDITWFHYVFTCSAKPGGICGVSTVKRYIKMIIRWSYSLWAWLFFLTACAEYASSLFSLTASATHSV